MKRDMNRGVEEGGKLGSKGVVRQGGGHGNGGGCNREVGARVFFGG